MKFWGRGEAIFATRQRAMQIRDAILADFDQITAIYNEIVLTSTAIYNDEPATPDERIAWWKSRCASGFPVMVATRKHVEEDGQTKQAESILGFASYGQFRSWPGYRYTVEGTVHVRSSSRGRGVGKALLDELVRRARGMGMHIMIAGVDAGNAASLKFLEGFGFEQVALLPEVGFKFGRFLDLVFLQFRLTPTRGSEAPTRGACDGD